MELILADGSERTIDGGDELRAARVGLGALGVVVAVTLRCVPRLPAARRRPPGAARRVLATLQERADAHDHFEFWTFPHSPLALTRTLDRTERPRRPPARPLRAYFNDVLMENGALDGVNRSPGRRPGRSRA